MLGNMPMHARLVTVTAMYLEYFVSALKMLRGREMLRTETCKYLKTCIPTPYFD